MCLINEHIKLIVRVCVAFIQIMYTTYVTLYTKCIIIIIHYLAYNGNPLLCLYVFCVWLLNYIQTVTVVLLPSY